MFMGNKIDTETIHFRKLDLRVGSEKLHLG